MSNETVIWVRDPVCGKTLDLAEAVAMQDYGGWAHFFCSDQCRSAIRAAPERYAQDTARRRAATLEHGD